MLDLAPHDVQDEGVARDLLIRLDLDYVTSLDTTPVGDLETLMALGEDELFHWLTIDFLGSLLQFFVVEQVETACGYDACNRYEYHMRIIRSLSLSRDSLRAKMQKQDHVVELE